MGFESKQEYGKRLVVIIADLFVTAMKIVVTLRLQFNSIQIIIQMPSLNSVFPGSD